MLARLILASTAFSFAVVITTARAAETLVGPPDSSSVADTRSEPEPVDETALRYYASLKQTSRVEAETRRLQRSNPNWRPPADLWTSRLGDAEEGPLWELFAADNLDDLRKAIEERRAREPGWAPSTDLATKLARKEARTRILAGKSAERWADIAAIADQTKFEDDTSDVALLWDISDAYARTERAADAMRILASIIRTRSSPQERIATIQRAITSLPMADAERLIAAANIDQTEGSEYAPLNVDITRARISAFLHDEPANEITPSELARFKAYARGTTDSSQQGLVAWYALKRNDLPEALEWFKIAIAQGGDATIAHGLAHTLRKLGKLREAEEIAYAWREPLPANAILFIDILVDQLTQSVPLPFEQARVSRFAEVTLKTSSGEGAQALAWFAYNSCQFEVAAEWFGRAVAWFPKETTVFGYALALRRLKRSKEAVEIINRYDGLFPSVIALLFPEPGIRPPPSQCDSPLARTPRTSRKANDILDLQPRDATRLLVDNGDRRPATSQSFAEIERATVPTPVKLARGVERTLPSIKRKDFPIAVGSENALRYPSAPDILRAASSTDWRGESRSYTALIARRVPGVGPMPYERFGITLLPAWTGSKQPSLVPEAVLRAPVGTLWHAEQTASRDLRTPGGPLESRAMSDAADLREKTILSRFHP